MTATWILQSKYPSSTQRTQTRVRYLGSIRGQMINHILAYYRHVEIENQKVPGSVDDTEVTLYVIEKLGQATIQGIARQYQKSTDTVLQDMGLFVAMLLCAVFGEENVETYRDDQTHRSSTRSRSSAWPNLKGVVSRYTPHRVVNPGTRNKSFVEKPKD